MTLHPSRVKLWSLGLVDAHTITMSEGSWTHWINIVINTVGTYGTFELNIISTEVDMTTARVEIQNLRRFFKQTYCC